MQFKMTVSDAVAKADALKKEIEILDLLIVLYIIAVKR